MNYSPFNCVLRPSTITSAWRGDRAPRLSCLGDSRLGRPVVLGGAVVIVVVDSRRLAGHQGLSGLKQHLLMERGNAGPADDDKDQGKYTLITDEEDPQLGMFDKRLPCFGCGIGWFSFLLGFAFPLMWFYATILYFSNYYRKDPRERTGLAASAITALIFSITLLITLAVIFL